MTSESVIAAIYMRRLRARVTVASVGMIWSAPHSALCTGLLGTGSAWCSLHKHPLSPFRRWHLDGGGGSSCAGTTRNTVQQVVIPTSSLPYTGKHPAPQTVHLLHRWILTTALWDRHNFLISQTEIKTERGSMTCTVPSLQIRFSSETIWLLVPTRDSIHHSLPFSFFFLPFFPPTPAV